MVNWGLGIEHEMRLRFSNKIDISNINDTHIKSIHKEFGYIPDYLFIDSRFLLNIYKKYVNILLKDFIINENKNNKNNKNEENINKYLDKLIYEKKEFPFDDIKFYNINDIELTKNNLYYYFNNYRKKNCKFLNLYITFNNKNNYNIFISSYKIYNNYTIINKMNKDEIKLHFDKLVDDTYEKEYIDIIKKNLKLSKFNIIEKYDDSIYIKIDVNNKKLPIINFKLLCKKIFDNDDIDDIDKNDFLLKFKNIDKLKLKKLSDNNIPHIDYSFGTNVLEFKTFDFKNKNYKIILDDLINIENIFFDIINEIPELKPLIKKYGNITYHHTGSLNKTIILNNLDYKFTEVVKDYAGSFHVWVTIPYSSKELPELFINKHINLANRLQLLEPIFASYFTSPDIESIGNDLKHSRSSLRHFLNNYAGYGTSDISLLYGIDKNNIDEYYLSKEDVLNGDKIDIYLKKKIYENNKIIKDYDGLTQRYGTSNNFKFLKENIDKNNNSIINDYLMQIFKNTKIKPFKNKYGYSTIIPLGADIRTTSMNKLFYKKVEDNYKKVYILENNVFNLYYHDTINNIITNKPKYNLKAYKKFMKDERIGIEFRIFDHFPTYEMIQFLAILSEIVCYSTLHYKTLEKKELYINQQYWHDEMAKSLISGFEYKLDTKYIKAIEKEFSIDISKNEISGEDFFNIFYDNMNKKLNKVEIYKKLRVDKKHFIFENINKKVWKYNFLLYLKNNKNILTGLQNILKLNNENIIKKENILKLLGSDFKYDIEKIYKVLLDL